jgi:putative transposase
MRGACCCGRRDRHFEFLDGIAMVGFRRNFVPGGTYFFTVTLANRRSQILVEHIEALREGYFSNEVLKSGATVARAANGDLILWQRRFWEHTIRDEGDFARHVDYIHFNPVKHGYVRRVADWPHSSFHRFVREGVLPDDWAGDVDEVTGQFGEPPEL